MATDSVLQRLLDAQPRRREHVGDAAARVAVAVEGIARIAAVGEMRREGVADLGAIVPDVEDVPAAVAAGLAPADVHRRHAEERALADPDARIADDAAAVE